MKIFGSDKQTKEAVYTRNEDSVRIDETPQASGKWVEVTLTFVPQFASPCKETGIILARCDGFPAQVGAGETGEEAQANLLIVLRAFGETFLAANGTTIFKRRLVEHGFKLQPQEVAIPAIGDFAHGALRWQPRAKTRIRWCWNARRYPGGRTRGPGA